MDLFIALVIIVGVAGFILYKKGVFTKHEQPAIVNAPVVSNPVPVVSKPETAPPAPVVPAPVAPSAPVTPSAPVAPDAWTPPWHPSAPPPRSKWAMGESYTAGLYAGATYSISGPVGRGYMVSVTQGIGAALNGDIGGSTQIKFDANGHATLAADKDCEVALDPV